MARGRRGCPSVPAVVVSTSSIGPSQGARVKCRCESFAVGSTCKTAKPRPPDLAPIVQSPGLTSVWVEVPPPVSTSTLFFCVPSGDGTARLGVLLVGTGVRPGRPDARRRFPEIRTGPRFRDRHRGSGTGCKPPVPGTARGSSGDGKRVGAVSRDGGSTTVHLSRTCSILRGAAPLVGGVSGRCRVGVMPRKAKKCGWLAAVRAVVAILSGWMCAGILHAYPETSARKSVLPRTGAGPQAGHTRKPE